MYGLRSTCGGVTWSAAANSRHASRTGDSASTTVSGNLLLVKHGPIDEKIGRERLTAYVSTDDGRTFREPPSDWQLPTWSDKRKWFAGSPQSLAGDLIRAGITDGLNLAVNRVAIDVDVGDQ